MNKWALLLLSAVPLTYVVGFAPGAAAMEPGTLIVAAAEETQTCPVCGYENKAGLNYCTMCGAPLIEEAPGEKIYCPECGAKIPETAKFCTKCGYSLKAKKPAARAAFERPPQTGVYFTGGLASYGGTEITTTYGERYKNDMGTSWAAGGGFVLPVWSKAGVVPLSLELSTDAGFSMIEMYVATGYVEKIGFKTSLIPIRETALLGVAFGPRKMIKPFCGFGGGVAILTSEYVLHEETLYHRTNVKPVFDIPFGCEFYLTPRFALGVKADYLIIPGDIEMEWDFGPYEFRVNASVPDVFLFGGTARFCF